MELTPEQTSEIELREGSFVNYYIPRRIKAFWDVSVVDVAGKFVIQISTYQKSPVRFSKNEND